MAKRKKNTSITETITQQLEQQPEMEIVKEEPVIEEIAEPVVETVPEPVIEETLEPEVVEVVDEVENTIPPVVEETKPQEPHIVSQAHSDSLTSEFNYALSSIL